MKLTDYKVNVAVIYVKGIEEVCRPAGLPVEDWYEEFGDYELRIPITNINKNTNKIVCNFLQDLGVDCNVKDLEDLNYIILFS
jgi:hypothetical protein